MEMSTMPTSSATMPSSASATSMSMGMGMGMGMTTANMMPMSQMMMTFFTSTTTPLFSSTWMPTSTAQYSGTCIFLVVFALIFRCLFALRSLQDRRWADAELERRVVRVAGKEIAKKSERTMLLSGIKDGQQEGEEGEEEVLVVKRKGANALGPWRLSQEMPRAVLDTVIAGVGYLLMIAVMTMNVGYFLAVLGGIFLGSVLVGRHARMSTGH